MRSRRLWILPLGLALLSPLACKKGDESAPSSGKMSAADVAAGKNTFDEKCALCHTIGKGIKKAPDLREVSKRHDRAWIGKWVADPAGMIKTDPIAQKLFDEWKQTQKDPMPPGNLGELQLNQVLAYIDEESTKPASVPPTQPAASTP